MTDKQGDDDRAKPPVVWGVQVVCIVALLIVVGIEATVDGFRASIAVYGILGGIAVGPEFTRIGRG